MAVGPAQLLLQPNESFPQSRSRDGCHSRSSSPTPSLTHARGGRFTRWRQSTWTCAISYADNPEYPDHCASADFDVGVDTPTDTPNQSLRGLINF